MRIGFSHRDPWGGGGGQGDGGVGGLNARNKDLVRPI